MSRTHPPDEVGDVVDFLQANLDLTTLPVDETEVDVDFANYDGGADTPGVRVHSPEVDLMRGGATGYSGMVPGGEGPTQDLRTTVQVDAWGGTINDEDVLAVHPEEAAMELRSEIWATVLHADPPEGYQYMSVLDTGTGHDTDASPTEYRQIVFVGLGYSLRPPSE